MRPLFLPPAAGGSLQTNHPLKSSRSPSFEADIPPTTPSSLEADQFNAPLFNARFAAATTLHRPEGDVQVSAGTPVLARRFPLSKLDLLAQNNPDANALQYYFGLKKNGIAYEYVADIGGRIAKLDEVAALGREPNFLRFYRRLFSPARWDAMRETVIPLIMTGMRSVIFR